MPGGTSSSPATNCSIPARVRPLTGAVDRAYSADRSSTGPTPPAPEGRR